MYIRFAKENMLCFMGSRILPYVLGCLFFVGMLPPAHAYKVNKDNKGRTLKWKSQAISWELNPGAFKKIPAAQLQAIFLKAFKKWQDIKCSKVSFVFRGISTRYANNKDKRNVISFPANFATKHGAQILFSSGFRMDANGHITDFDIELNPGINWSTGPSGGGQDLEAVATVLAGRLLGLADSSTKGATMEGSSFLTGDISRRSLHWDDVEGASFLYPTGGAGCTAKTNCSQDADCSSVDLVCQSGKCAGAKNSKAGTNICKPCKTSGDCGTSMACDLLSNATYCLQLCSPDGLCPTNYSCNGSGINAQCLPATGLCAAAGCTKDADCSGGFKCKSGKCKPECDTNADCPSTKPQCQGGRCAAKGSCSRDLDCSVGMVCKAQQCVPSGDKCTQNSDCKNAGEKCITGYCKLVSSCKTDNDCPNGQICKNSYCQPSTSPCQNGKKQTCSCGPKSGSQTCVGGKWDTCQCGGPLTCTPSSTQKCTCTGSQSGTKTCAADGSAWGACQCGGGKQICKPGATQVCACPGSKQGAQSCANDGLRWETCQCSGGCTDGQTQNCTCGTQQGTQTCTNKIWSTCQCSGGKQNCVPGSTQVCVCPGNKQGAQSCANDGLRWEACQCEGAKPSTDTGTQSDGGTSSVQCESHGQCPASQICAKGVCTSQQPAKTGCGCNTTPSQQGTLWLLLLLLALPFVTRMVPISRSIQ